MNYNLVLMNHKISIAMSMIMPKQMKMIEVTKSHIAESPPQQGSGRNGGWV